VRQFRGPTLAARLIGYSPTKKEKKKERQTEANCSDKDPGATGGLVSHLFHSQVMMIAFMITLGDIM